MCERFGCRIVIICGGFICIVGFLFLLLVISLFLLYLIYGFMFGVGMSFCYFFIIIVFFKYFKCWIVVVNGLVIVGSGVGMLVIGLVV